jgi:group I intron endonuclease
MNNIFINSYYYPWDVVSLKSENQGKSGVYIIINNITKEFYIGSAISKNEKSNRLYIRFRNHFLHSHKITNINLHRAILKYGKKNFSYHILEYTLVNETRFIETKYIQSLKPTYNILFSCGETGLITYKHSDETNEMMKRAYSSLDGFKKKEKIGSLNRDKYLSKDTINLMSLAAKKRLEYVESRAQHSQSMNKNKNKHTFSKKTAVYNSFTNILIYVFPSAKDVARFYYINYRTVRRHIKSGIPIKKLNIIIKYNL